MYIQGNTDIDYISVQSDINIKTIRQIKVLKKLVVRCWGDWKEIELLET